MREVYKNGLNYFKNVGQCFYTNNNNNKNHNNSGNKTGVMAWQLNMTPYVYGKYCSGYIISLKFLSDHINHKRTKCERTLA